MKPIPSGLAAFIRGALIRYDWTTDAELLSTLTAQAKPHVLSQIGGRRVRAIALRTEPVRRTRREEKEARGQWAGGRRGI